MKTLNVSVVFTHWPFPIVLMNSKFHNVQLSRVQCPGTLLAQEPQNSVWE